MSKLPSTTIIPDTIVVANEIICNFLYVGVIDVFAIIMHLERMIAELMIKVEKLEGAKEVDPRIFAYISGWLDRDDECKSTQEHYEHSILRGLQKLDLTNTISLDLVGLWVQGVERGRR